MSALPVLGLQAAQQSQPAAGVLHLALAAAVLLSAAAALFAPRRMAAVVLFLIFGVLASAYWGAIGAPDVALAEAVIGTGVTGALFGFAATVLPASMDGARPRGWAMLLGALLGTALGAGLAVVLVGAADRSGPRPGLAEEVTAALPRTGVEHPITGVLLNLRSFDTLMEMVVLLAAAAIAIAFLPRPSRAVGPEARADGGADKGAAVSALHLFASLAAPAVLLLAAWLLFAGSTQPGGAFQAGAAFAAVLILLSSAGIRSLPLSTLMLVLLVLGVAAFLLVAVAGVVLGSAWLELRGPWAGAVTIALEAALAVTIGASLAAVYSALTRAPSQSPSQQEAGG